MKRFFIMAGLLGLVSTTFTSCEIIGDIFQAGMAVGVIVVILVIALIVFIVRKLR